MAKATDQALRKSDALSAAFQLLATGRELSLADFNAYMKEMDRNDPAAWEFALTAAHAVEKAERYIAMMSLRAALPDDHAEKAHMDGEVLKAIKLQDDWDYHQMDAMLKVFADEPEGSPLQSKLEESIIREIRSQKDHESINTIIRAGVNAYKQIPDEYEDFKEAVVKIVMARLNNPSNIYIDAFLSANFIRTQLRDNAAVRRDMEARMLKELKTSRRGRSDDVASIWIDEVSDRDGNRAFADALKDHLLATIGTDRFHDATNALRALVNRKSEMGGPVRTLAKQVADILVQAHEKARVSAKNYEEKYRLYESSLSLWDNSRPSMSPFEREYTDRFLAIAIRGLPDNLDREGEVFRKMPWIWAQATHKDLKGAVTDFYFSRDSKETDEAAFERFRRNTSHLHNYALNAEDKDHAKAIKALYLIGVEKTLALIDGLPTNKQTNAALNLHAGDQPEELQARILERALAGVDALPVYKPGDKWESHDQLHETLSLKRYAKRGSELRKKIEQKAVDLVKAQGDKTRFDAACRAMWSFRDSEESDALDIRNPLHVQLIDIAMSSIKAAPKAERLDDILSLRRLTPSMTTMRQTADTMLVDYVTALPLGARAVALTTIGEKIPDESPIWSRLRLMAHITPTQALAALQRPNANN